MYEYSGKYYLDASFYEHRQNLSIHHTDGLCEMRRGTSVSVDLPLSICALFVLIK